MSQLSVYRNEDKYLLTLDEAMSLSGKLGQILRRDSYSESGPYTVRSLYFDSADDRDYYEKLAGNEIRRKIRLRTYSVYADRCKLEVKQKNGNLQHKVSLWVTREDAKEFCKGAFDTLSDYSSENSEAVYIYSELICGAYRPRVLVEYDRLAFMHELFSTRITFDMNVRSSESCFDLFESEAALLPVFNNMTVLEVKYNGVLLDEVSDLLKSYDLSRTSLSKYCISRRVYFDL